MLFVWVRILFVFWLASLEAKKEPAVEKMTVPGRVPQRIPGIK